MRPHEKLEVWNRSVEFAVKIYEFTKKSRPTKGMGCLLKFGVRVFRFLQILLKVLQGNQIKSFFSSFQLHKVRRAKLRPNC